MKRVLFILGQFDNLDIEWMIDNGLKKDVLLGESLIRQGEEIKNLYIILSGEFSVRSESRKDVEIAKIGSGEVVGEMSFIDSRPPAASVIATEHSTVFYIPHDCMQRKLEDDAEFSSRFYLAMAMFLSSRLRNTMNTLGFDIPKEDMDEIDTNVLDNVAMAGARFGQILNKFSEV